MLCQICKQREATGHYVQVVGASKVLELHICDECAKKMLENRRTAATFGSKGVQDWLSSIATPSTDATIEKTCPSCGRKLNAFIQANFQGCPTCSTAFKEYLGKMLDGFEETPENVDNLKEELERAIIEERFEDAALIRDRLRSMQRKTKHSKLD